jgi:hypothetical protein
MWCASFISTLVHRACACISYIDSTLTFFLPGSEQLTTHFILDQEALAAQQHVLTTIRTSHL